MERIVLISKKDLEISFFNGGGGGGGQHRNRHNNCVRIYHAASGATATASKHKDLPSNQKEAFCNLMKTPAMKTWLALKLKEIRDQETIEEKIDRLMQPENLKVEVIKDGQWIEE